MALRRPPQKAKRDANEGPLVAELRAYGFSVYLLDRPSDAVVGKHGRTWLVEFKDEKGDLTPAQEKFYETWRGNKDILRNFDDVRMFAQNAGTIQHRGQIG